MQQLQDALARQNSRSLTVIGAAASALWLALVLLAAWLMPAQYSGGLLAWLVRALGVVLPLGLIWFGVWTAQALLALREEAVALRETLDHLRGPGGAPAVARSPRAQRPAQPAPQPVSPPVTQPVSPSAASRPAPAEAPHAPQLTPTEMYFALNFPDGPEDREAIRCLRLALADPVLARLIRAAQDVVTLLAGRGVYMDDLQLPETDPGLWQRFCDGARGEAVAGLAVIDDPAALATAAEMIAGDEVFRDVAHHFLRHFDRMLGERASIDDPNVLAVLAETRSGRAFILLAQVTGIIGGRAAGRADDRNDDDIGTAEPEPEPELEPGARQSEPADAPSR